MFYPASTYRIQFNKDFTFNDFLKDKEYFFMLHPSAVYASPVLEAAPGSNHGYDVTNPGRINPEIGTMSEYTRLNGELASNGIGWIQDIVPNHMAFHNNNARLTDVLEKGKASKYASFFDIDFSHPELEDKVIVPFLGKPLQQCLADHEIITEWKDGNFRFRYYDYIFPFSYESFRELMLIKKAFMPGEFASILQKYNIEGYPAPEFLNNEWTGLKSAARSHYEKSSAFRDFISNAADSINSDPELAAKLLQMQHYRLAYWRESGNIMNYRRFFTVNGLICLNIDDDKVFDEYHDFIRQEIESKRVRGLRVDHIDGLKKPEYYLEKLRLLAGDDVYIVIEKILEADEKLPLNFPIQGTSGYDYLSVVNNLLTKKTNYKKLKQFYRDFTGIKDDVAEIIYNKKKSILTESMNGELENLARMFDESGFVTYDADVTREMIKEAIGEFLVAFPVYKLYSDSFPLPKNEAEVIVNVFTKARNRYPYLHKPFDILEDLFLEHDHDEARRIKALNFWLRCLQFTGPLMAKGVEDTVMYYYNYFIAHNEVGDNPGSEGITAEDYHHLMQEKRRYWPGSMNATSTHDTKRGEDVRARLNVISEIPEEWIRSVREWQKINASGKIASGAKTAPDPNEEYFIYQTLAGTFPMDGNVTEDYSKRVGEYLLKSLKEAKTNSNWLDPDTDYEKAVTDFTSAILQEGSKFLKSFLPLQKKLATYGIINSLSQLMLKVTSPGIPDFYQGTELWDLSMVDPDNRRPVDYAGRLRMLKEIDEMKIRDPENFIGTMKGSYFDGRLKLWMTYELLRERENDPGLFLHGSYVPLETAGKYKDNVIAYARTKGSKWFIVIVPLYLAAADKDSRFAKIHEFDWKDTSVMLPEMAPASWSVFNGSKVKVTGKISLSAVMKFPCPVFLKGGNDHQSRFAGVLSHISSLPGEYGTGDLGETAYRFAHILKQNGQSFWQILPFNPVGEGYAFSPYSSISAFAGNTMFISPDLLVQSGYINEKSLNTVAFEESGRTDFIRAINFRRIISDDAFADFFLRNRPLHYARFKKFCENEEYWLNDFALFSVIRQENKNLPWVEWPVKLKNRDVESLNEIQAKYESEIKKIKLMQFMFQEQWLSLKRYCNAVGIRLIGDMSFYVNYDSADVWSHPGYFRLDRNKAPVKVAGVPPDYFSSTGQLWNMPVYSWSRLKKDGYEWWLRRIKRNLDLSDLVRFDHFRAFSEYWEVPYGETTAEKGEWVTGPAYDFFKKVRSVFPSMPFIAEDLGTIDEKVYSLRDDFALPGMVVLQFAFGDDVSRSAYAPHYHTYNSIVYTGTHDNNTTRGWFAKDLTDWNRLDLIEYLGYPVSEETCNEDFIRMAYKSVAKIAIIPVQDLLGLDETGRLNMPSTSENNWDWKMKKADLDKIFSDKIRRMVKLYGRI
ncbi:MAG TPA: malto-oligosyltrehalose synthase [Bacteroidales bacterium]|nr:malto-oligosyltrehalose synthase [Bacteroidales bacterium]